jgi:hypothetical protein
VPSIPEGLKFFSPNRVWKSIGKVVTFIFRDEAFGQISDSTIKTSVQGSYPIDRIDASHTTHLDDHYYLLDENLTG